jgi:formamidopyrimidine-DNA glycosylase
VIVHDAFLLRQQSEEFIRRLKGQTIDQVTRRGKAVIVHLASQEFLVIQLMMTGQLIFNGPEDRHTRIDFNFSDGSRLLYNDQRRFGQLRVVASLNEVRHLNILGPEPFSKVFSPVFMRQVFQKTIRPIKNVLLDHTFVAGIGNIYACEILFRSHVNPKKPARRLSFEETHSIHRYIVEVLKEAIKYRGSSMRNYRDSSGQKGGFNKRLSVYARQGLPCPRCKKNILRIVQAGRSTFYCGHCQK